MLEINIHEAKTHLSKYLAQLKPGEAVMICNRNKPVAELRTLARPPRKKRRKFGSGRGLVTIHDGFFDPLSEEELGFWYGPDAYGKPRKK